MSDALSDIRKDERRAEAIYGWRQAVKAYLADPSEENKKAAMDWAVKADGIRGGYWGGRTELVDMTPDALSSLLAGETHYAKEVFG